MRLFARGLLSASWPTPLSYRAAAQSSNVPSGSPFNKPAGVTTGDLVVVVCGASVYPASFSTNTGDTWSRDASATNIIFWKVLNATDVAQAWVSSDSGVYAMAAAYADNGVAIASAAVRSSADAAGSATSLTIPGFTMGARGRPRAIIAAVSGTVVTGNYVAAPSGFTERAERDNPEMNVADAQRTYNYGSATFTGLQGPGAGTQSGWLLEVH